VSPRDLPVRRGLVIPGAELAESASRSGGPGGQHVNKTSTRVTLRWKLRDSDVLGPQQRRRLEATLASRITRAGELVVHASRHRSRSRNRELARERLAELVRQGLATRRSRMASRPTRASQRRRVGTKRHRARVKQERRPPGAEEW